MTGIRAKLGSVPRDSLKDIPLKITPETVVDVENLTPLEQEIYNLTLDQWRDIEQEVIG